MRARDLLGPSGPLASDFAGYEDRPAQLAMADAVERALAEDRVLVCEAGTGTGKTLAYLVPAILSGRRVVVSTATKALQDQIFEKDLPLVRRVLGLEVNAALVKGLGNYLCRRRFEELRRSPEALKPEYARSLAAVERWVGTSPSGDVAELDDLSEDDALWHEISSSSETRIGSSCAYFDECFVTRMKRRAERAQLLVVNHALFFADLAVRGPHQGGALPDYDAVIFDEAHQLEDVATNFFGLRVSSARLESMLRDAERAFVASGILDKRRKGEAAAILAVAREAGQRFFGDLAHAHGSSDGRAPFARDALAPALVAAWHKLDAAVEALGAHAEARKTTEAVELVAKRATQLRDDLATILDGSHGKVTWVEVRPRSAALGASPIDVSEVLRAQLFDRVPAVVLTSATLATNEGCRFLRSRLGIVEGERPIDELAVPSPFDYASRALLYVPRDLPDPRDGAWLSAASARALELVRATGGGAFVLSTSNRAMRAIHAELAREGVPRLLLQGEAPKGLLLSRFREAGDAVLVATMSFWEGVDVPGRALRLVVLDKIPFAVPTDPVVVARSKALEEAGENPFARLHVPAAAIALKQGFGRLIRTRTDAGVVAILDGRVHTKGYGRALVASLPPATRTDRIEEVRAFVERMGLGERSG